MRRLRKGFAIVLVASLAGLVFLLGASLVVVTRLQTTAANYDQRVRLAKEHARAALDIALAELQKNLGPDTAVSYTADVYRDDRSDDFKSPSDPSGLNVVQPFWTAAKGVGLERWLVTRPIQGDFNGLSDGTEADPLIDVPGETVVLVGEGTAGSNSYLSVSVPKEGIGTVELLGYSGARTIGHHAYWVGDLGTKASYTLYDKASSVTHGEYSSASKRERLSQLRAPGVEFDTVSVSEGDNPSRIDDFVSNFQFRDRFGSSSEGYEYFLDGLTEAEAKARFHDFTPRSSGLLVNSKGGGFKEDLTPFAIENWGDPKLSPFREYASFARSGNVTESEYDSAVFAMQPGSLVEEQIIDGNPTQVDVSQLPIHPVMTQFNLNYCVHMDKIEGTDNEHLLILEFAVGIELWNPFTSAIKGETLRMEISGLPRLKLDLTPVDWIGDLGSLSKTPSFLITDIDGENWLPGRVLTFSGPHRDDANGTGPFVLSRGAAYVSSSSDRVVISDLNHQAAGPIGGMPFSFVDEAGNPAVADIAVSMYIDKGGDEDDVLLASYALSEGIGFSVPSDAIDYTPFVNSDATFGFSWSISDSEIPSFSNYLPMSDELSQSALDSFDTDATGFANTQPDFQNASSILLLGHGGSSGSSQIKDISALQLPKQELTSVANLSGAFGPTLVNPGIGNPGDPDNNLFDEYFFSTVDSDWDSANPLPNQGYRPRDRASSAGLNSINSANELFAHGMFNVHSTSIDSWLALLKGNPGSKHPHWGRVLGLLNEDGTRTSSEELYLFFNYDQSAEDRFVFQQTPASSIDEIRVSTSQGAMAFLSDDLEVLAEYIVKNIRERVQGVAPNYIGSNVGNFDSMEEFLNSGVLENAITQANLDEEALSVTKVFRPSWVVADSNRYFKQSTILNLLAPYLSVRSDTFLVRAYGDVVNPVDSSQVWARAYCEAVVQRTHEMHSDTSLGRRFEVVAFRWLSPSEI